MSRTLRVHKIDQMLNNRHHVSIQDFLDELEVSLPTFKRDIAFMRLHLNAPIVFDSTLKAYRFSRSDAVGPRYELPGLWLSASESHALLTANSLLESIEPGLLGKHVGPLKTRLKTLLASQGMDPTAVSERIQVIQSLRRKTPLRHFEVIAHATLKGRRVRIYHYNRNTHEHTTRELSPQRLTYYRENWYLDAWCHERNALRSFAVDAIESVEILEVDAYRLTKHEVDAVLNNGYGIFSGLEQQWAVLDFSPDRAQWLSRMTWHDDLNAKWLPNGWYRVEFPYNDDRELLNDILMHTPDVIVQSPKALQERVMAALQKGLSRYASESVS